MINGRLPCVYYNQRSALMLMCTRVRMHNCIRLEFSDFGQLRPFRGFI